METLPNDHSDERSAMLVAEVERVMDMRESRKPETSIREMIRLVFETEPWVGVNVGEIIPNSGRFMEWMEFYP